MSNNVRATRREPEDRRGQIIAVAGAHFSRAGYDRASISAIAADIGVTRALVHHYFPTKALLFEAVLRTEAAALLAATAFDPALSPLDNIRRAVQAYLDQFSLPTDVAVNLHTQAEAHPVLAAQIIRANHAAMAQRVMAALELEPAGLTHAAVMAWLEFVATLARQLCTDPHADRATATQLCIGMLMSLAAASGSHAEVSRPVNADRP